MRWQRSGTSSGRPRSRHNSGERPPGIEQPAGVAPVTLALGLTAMGLLGSFLLKVQCVVRPWSNLYQYRRLCYNDIQPLFGIRGISRGLVPYRDVIVEYPVLTGMFMDLAGRVLRGLVRLGWVPAAGDPQYFLVSAAMLAPFAVAVTLMLRPRVTPGRLALWACGSPIILYAFHNWDLLAVAAAVWGLVSYERESTAGAGLALALGASAKLFPAFLMPPALLGRWGERDRRGAVHLIAGFLVMYAVVNVPWVLVSGAPPRPALSGSGLAGVTLRPPGTNGWLGVWQFHARRYPDFGTVWYWISVWSGKLTGSTWWSGPGYRSAVNLLGLALFAAGSSWLLWKGWKRRSEPQGYPVAAVGLGILAMFLLTSKVHSPQYALWLIPMLALVDVPWRFVIGYLVTDVLVYVSGFYWFTQMNQPSSAWMRLFEAGVWARAGALAALIWCCAKARRLDPATPREGSGNRRTPAPAVPVPAGLPAGDAEGGKPARKRYFLFAHHPDRGGNCHPRYL